MFVLVTCACKQYAVRTPILHTRKVAHTVYRAESPETTTFCHDLRRTLCEVVFVGRQPPCPRSHQCHCGRRLGRQEQETSWSFRSMASRTKALGGSRRARNRVRVPRHPQSRCTGLRPLVRCSQWSSKERRHKVIDDDDGENEKYFDEGSTLFNRCPCLCRYLSCSCCPLHSTRIESGCIAQCDPSNQFWKRALPAS
jgi:hypothetical protein